MDYENTSFFWQSYMEPDELVLWKGCPEKKGLFMTKYEFHAFLFSIFWTVASAGFLALGWIGSPGEPILIAFTVIFPAVGIFFVAGSLRKALRARNNTEYVITNKRILRRVGDTVNVFSEGICDGYRTEIHRNGTATIRFPMVIEPNAMRVRVNGREVIQCFELKNISEVDRVHHALATMDIHQY